jgi:hypothetical protein
MKLIYSKISTDAQSFSPLIRLTIELPLEIVRDGVALMGVDEVKMVLGTELYDLLKETMRIIHGQND